MLKSCPDCGTSIEVPPGSDDHYSSCPNCARTLLFEAGEPGTVFSPRAPAFPETKVEGKSGRPRLGRFELLRELGSGGFGSVHKARDTQLDRIVALKIPHSGSFINAEEKACFLREGQAAAGLEHPGIVRVFDAGEIAGTPYIASQFVSGTTLANYKATKRLSFRESAQLVAQIADALQHAHEHRVVHRDVKPSNIMIADNGRPMLMDFGLAKDFQRDASMTSEGRIKGTPAYMSPEQAAGETHRIDHRTDVYSLGVVLYELLTGERPFGGTQQKILDHIRYDEPRSLRSYNGKAPLDLQTICQKAMDKTISKRYQTAEEFADDLRRWLGNEPIRARRIGMTGRAVRWCRRNPGVTVSAATIFSILAAATTVSTWLYIGEREALRRETEALAGERQAVRQANRRISQLYVGQAKLDAGQDVISALPLLAEAYRLDKGDEQREAMSKMRLQCTLRACPRLERVWFCEAAISRLAVSRDRKVFAAASVDGIIRICDVETGKILHEIKGQIGDYSALEFTADDRHLAAAVAMVATMWNVETGQQVATIKYEHPVEDLIISGSEDLIATTHFDNRARLWRWRENGEHRVDELKNKTTVNALALNPQGTLLATGDLDGLIRFWIPKTGDAAPQTLTPASEIQALAYDRNGRYLATATADKNIQVWDTNTFDALYAAPPAVPFVISQIRFSPDGSRLAISGKVGRYNCALCNVEKDAPNTRLLWHEREVRQFEFSNDGRSLLTACDDAFVRIWDVEAGTLRDPPLLHGGSVNCAAFIDDSKILTAGADQTIRQWNTARSETTIPLAQRSPEVFCIAPDGQKILVGGKDRTAREYNVDGGALPIEPMQHTGAVKSVAYNFDGSICATGSVDGTSRVWNAETGAPITQPMLHPARFVNVRFSPNGEFLGTVCGDRTARIWSTRTGKLESTYEHSDSVDSLDFSPSGKSLATASADGSAYIWNIDSANNLQPAAKLVHPAPVKQLAYHPSDDLILTVAADNIVRVWECKSGMTQAISTRHTGPVRIAKFSPDGSRVLSAGEDGTVRIWDSRTAESITPTLFHGSAVLDASFSSNGRLVVSCSRDDVVRVWDALTGEPIVPPLRRLKRVLQCGFCSDSQTVIALTSEGALLVYRLPNFIDERDVDLQAKLLSSHRVDEGAGLSAIAPGEYRVLVNRAERSGMLLSH